MKYDFVLKNGHVIDPANNIDQVLDVAVKDGKISSVHAAIPESDASAVYDVTGLYVTPGLVDSHVHCFFTAGTAKAWAGDYSLQPDFFNFPAGVTTIVDAGSAGSCNFDIFRTSVIARAKSKIYALLNIADYGMASLMDEQFPKKNDMAAFVSCAERNKDLIYGIKIAHYWADDWGSVDCAKRFQERVCLPIMVDFGHFRPSRPYDTLVMEKLSPGDISTHCFRAPVPVVDENGRVYDYLFKARERGIRFDMGHGASSFALRNAVPAMRQGFLPDTFSSDLHALDVTGTAVNMAHILSKMLACCDMPLNELFRRVTIEPAKMLRLKGVGTLTTGEDADIAVWSLQHGNYGYRDGDGGKIAGSRRLECEMTFRAGENVWDINARTSTAFEKLPQWYGIYGRDERIPPTH